MYHSPQNNKENGITARITRMYEFLQHEISQIDEQVLTGAIWAEHGDLIKDRLWLDFHQQLGVFGITSAELGLREALEPHLDAVIDQQLEDHPTLPLDALHDYLALGNSRTVSRRIEDTNATAPSAKYEFFRANKWGFTAKVPADAVIDLYEHGLVSCPKNGSYGLSLFGALVLKRLDQRFGISSAEQDFYRFRSYLDPVKRKIAPKTAMPRPELR
jgi:hypothetical protein